MSSRCLQDVFKTNKCLLGYLSVFHVIVNGLREVEKVLFERVYYIQTIEEHIVSVQQVHGF